MIVSKMQNIIQIFKEVTFFLENKCQTDMMVLIESRIYTLVLQLMQLLKCGSFN